MPFLAAAMLAAQPSAAFTPNPPGSPKALVDYTCAPVSVTTANGRTIIDFGREAAGWVEINASAAGDYEFIVGEQLNPDGSVFVNSSYVGSPWWCYNFAPKGATIKSVNGTTDVSYSTIRHLKFAESRTDTGWIAFKPTMRQMGYSATSSWGVAPASIDAETVSPFRYVEIVKAPFAITASNIRRTERRYPYDLEESSFTSSNANLNRVYEFCKYSTAALTYPGKFVDGDRERKLYEGDMFVQNFCSYAISSDCAFPRASIGTFTRNTHTWPHEWRMLFVGLVRNDWMWTGDTTLASSRYAELQDLVKYFLPGGDGAQYRASDGLLDTQNDGTAGLAYKTIVDWPKAYRYGYDYDEATSFTRKVTAVPNAFFYQMNVWMAEIATALGKTSDATTYASRAASLKTAFNNAFFDSAKGYYKDAEGSTHYSVQANAAALWCGLVPDNKLAGVVNFLKVQGMKCSAYFSQYLLDALAKNGAADKAVELMASSGENSWIRMMDTYGATTTLEAWELKSMSGKNDDVPDMTHGWTAAPVNVIARCILGVEPAAAGWTKATIRPQFGSLTQVSGKVPTAKGPVEVAYQNLTLTVTVPAGMQAEVTFAGQMKTVAADAATRTVTIGATEPSHEGVPLELSKIFQSNMVIQRDRAVRVWGKGPTGQTVTVAFAGQKATSAAIGEDDLWEVTFTRPFAANPTGQTLKATCSDGSTVTLTDVLVGDVWIAAGQSNMVMPVKGSQYGDTYDADATVADMANHPQIRWMAMDIDYNNAPTPEPYVVKGGGWGKAAGNLSAVAYHFAHDCVTAHPEVPVGIVGCYCNALSIGYWTPGGSKTLWNCQLAPITRFAVRGALWYQGETDAYGTEIRDHRWYGRDLLKPMVEAWRSAFGVSAEDFPFYFVQLAGYLNNSSADDPSGDGDNGYRAVRESLFWARRNIENSGMVVAWDCGRLKLDGEQDVTCQHPKCKNVLGSRLALLALRNVYGDNVVAESPYWTETVTDGKGNIRVKFDLNGSAGLTTALKNWNDAAFPVKTTGEPLKGFAIAGSDKKWSWADAVIESKDTIRLSSDKVAAPLYVRYCYRNNPVGGIANGYSEDLLPIAPIATEYSWYADVRKVGGTEPGETDPTQPDTPPTEPDTPPTEPDTPPDEPTETTESVTNAMTRASWGYEITGGSLADDKVLVFTNTTETMTVTLPAAVDSISYLLVAGGGGGGGSPDVNCGGGGGGAGAVRQGRLEGVAGASLTITVGRGGASVSGGYGVNGGDSSVRLSAGTAEERFIDAKGGGGGAAGQLRVGKAGSSGGCGGGGTHSGAGGATLASADEHIFGNIGAAGDGFANLSWGGGGGGASRMEEGKGGRPQENVGNGKQCVGGKGGDGVACDITGVSVVYGGGGGGGAAHTNNGTGGAGGLGGGGRGSTGSNAKATAGVDGLGGGGGGMDGGHLNAAAGARGGNGLVVIRIAAAGGEVQEPEQPEDPEQPGEPEEPSDPVERPDVFVWTGGGADRSWTTAGNWAGGFLPEGTDSVRFADGATNVVSVDAAVANPAARTMCLGAQASVTFANDESKEIRTLVVGNGAEEPYTLVPAGSELTVSGKRLSATFANMRFAGTIRATDGATFASQDTIQFGGGFSDRPRLVATDGATIDLPRVQFFNALPSFAAGPDSRINICGINVHKDGLAIDLDDGVLSSRNEGTYAYLQLGDNGSGTPGTAEVTLRGRKSQLHSTMRVYIGKAGTSRKVTMRLFPDVSWTESDAVAKIAGTEITLNAGLSLVVDVAAFNGRRTPSRIPLCRASQSLKVNAVPEVRVVENGEETDFARRLCAVAFETNANGRAADLVITPKRDPGLVVSLGPDGSGASSATWTADLSLRFEFPTDPTGLVPTAPVAFTLADDDTGALRWVGWTGGVAHWFAGPDSVGDWQNVRIEARRMGGRSYVGFAVLGADGAATQLADANGNMWFPMDDETVRSVATATFAGGGEHGPVDFRRDTTSEQPVLYWIGGEAGDWNAATNWSETAGGEPANRVPTNELVRVEGRVRFTRGDETAVVSDFLGKVGKKGGLELYSGAVRTPATLDTTRPRAGKKLELESAPFGGFTPSVAATWSRRGANEPDTAYEPVAEGPSFTPRQTDWEHWIRCAWTDENGTDVSQEFFFSKLPVLYLTTDDGKTPTAAKEKHDGRVLVQGNDEWKSLYDGKMTINVRGNSTAEEEKKPWKLKLDKKTKMFDMAKSKHWVLLANAIDKSNMRDKLAYDFANAIGSQGMHSTWVECVLNGEWQGLYLFCEQIRVDKDRVNVFDWEQEAEDRGIDGGDEDFSWVTDTDDITGGYIFEFDGKVDAGQHSVYYLSLGPGGGMPTQINTPEMLDTNKRMLDWTKGYLQTYFDATTSVDGYAEGKHYSEYCDVGSMVAYFLVMEMCGNFDCSQFSRYAYKDRGKPLVFGPVWDFDFDMGNLARQTAKDGANIMDPRQWQVQHCDSAKGNVCFYKEWADDPWFCTLLYRQYWNLARAEFVRMIASIDDYDAVLREPAEANGVKWTKYDTYSDAVRRLKSYLTTRLAWMDEQFANVPTLMASLEAATHSNTFGYVPSAWPYARDERGLAMSFDNAPEGWVARGKTLQLAVRVTAANAATVGVYVNGLKLGESLAVTDGAVRAQIPSSALVSDPSGPNCIALVARAADGTVVARNYTLVRQVQPGFLLEIR